MSPEALLSLVLFVLVGTITPGGATSLAMASGAKFGLQRSAPLIAGVAFGLATLAAAAAAGLAAIVLAAPALHLSMKLAGSAYLLWLAWKIGGSDVPSFKDDVQSPTGFIGAACLLWLNPKAWALALGAAAAFAALATGAAELVVILAIAFGVAGTLSMTSWCLGGSFLARLLRTERQWKVLNIALACLLVLSIAMMWRQ